MAQILLPTKDVHSFYSAASYGHTPEYNEYLSTLTFAPGREGVVGRVLLEHRPVQIADVLADPDYRLREVQRLGGFRTHLGLPLLRERKPIGILIVSRATVQPFDDKHIALLTTFADQAVVAIENTRLFEAEQQRTRELTESLERQTATSDVLRVISSSPTDIQPVLETIGERAEKLCDAEASLVSIVDGELIRLASIHGITEAGVEAVRGLFPMRRTDETITARAIRTRSVCHVADVLSDPQYQAKDAARVTGFRSNLAVPMVRDEQVVGAIFVARRKPGLFSDTQVQLLKTFADQAVIAIENVRLFNETKISLEQQTATADVLKVISRSTFDLQVVLNTLVESAARLCEADIATGLRIVGSVAEIAASYGLTPELHEQSKMIKFEPGRGSVAARVLLEGSIVHVHDVRSEPEYRMNAVVEMMGARTVLSVPLLREGTPIGIFSIMRRTVRPFTERQIELISTFADQAVIAIENARLFEAEQQRTRELTESLEQQTATSEVLQVISSSPGDLQPVFATMLANMVRVCNATHGSVYRFDGDAFRFIAQHNTLPAHAELTRYSPFRPGPKHYLARMIATKAVDHVADLAAEQGYLERRPEYVTAVELGRTRTALFVPMLKENKLIGVFAVGRQELRPFTDKQIELVQNFAAQAVIAIENTRLLNELRKLLQQQTATAEVLKVISSSPGELDGVTGRPRRKPCRRASFAACLRNGGRPSN